MHWQENLVPQVEFLRLGWPIIGQPLLALGDEQVLPDNQATLLDSLLNLLHKLSDRLKGRRRLFSGFPCHVKETLWSLPEQELKGREPHGHLGSLVDSEQHVGEEQVPIVTLYVDYAA